MNLTDFVQSFFKISLNKNIQYTGMTDSTREDTLSFLDNVEFIEDLKKNQNIVAVLIRAKDLHLLPENVLGIVVDAPKSTFFDLHNEYYKNYFSYNDSLISDTAQIDKSAAISHNGVTIGHNVIIGANATILPGVEIGENSTVGPNCVIGYDGFHVYSDIHNVKQVVFHDGNVIIGKNVDIQASVTIDKGLMGRDTIIADECKVDNAVHIAHRVHIGKKTLVASSACIAGSVEIGENVWIGPRSVISNRVSICDNARILIGSVVIRNIKKEISVSGNFAMEHTKHIKSQCQ